MTVGQECAKRPGEQAIQARGGAGSSSKGGGKGEGSRHGSVVCKADDSDKVVECEILVMWARAGGRIVIGLERKPQGR